MLAKPSATKARVAFLASPRQHTLAKLHSRLTSAKKCSTRGRAVDLLRFLECRTRQSHRPCAHSLVRAVVHLWCLERHQRLLARAGAISRGPWRVVVQQIGQWALVMDIGHRHHGTVRQPRVADRVCSTWPIFANSAPPNLCVSSRPRNFNSVVPSGIRARPRSFV